MDLGKLLEFFRCQCFSSDRWGNSGHLDTNARWIVWTTWRLEGWRHSVELAAVINHTDWLPGLLSLRKLTVITGRLRCFRTFTVLCYLSLAVVDSCGCHECLLLVIFFVIICSEKDQINKLLLILQHIRLHQMLLRVRSKRYCGSEVRAGFPAGSRRSLWNVPQLLLYVICYWLQWTFILLQGFRLQRCGQGATWTAGSFSVEDGGGMHTCLFSAYQLFTYLFLGEST